MKNVIRCMAMLALCSTSCAWASGVVRIADGDCTALAAAAALPAGQEPSLIVLARNGHYGACEFAVGGNIVIDGAGASLTPRGYGTSSVGQFTIAVGARLTMRQLNIAEPTVAATSSSDTAKPNILPPSRPIFFNQGSLVLDTVSVFNSEFGIGLDAALFVNEGDMTLRNLTVTNLFVLTGGELIRGSGTATVSASTLTNNYPILFGEGNISISNSVIAGNLHNCCSKSSSPSPCDLTTPLKLVSLGGNVTDNAECSLNGSNDRVVADLHLLELATHGGVVNNVALRNDSPAVGNGVASLCEATDARGFSRGQSSCDSGAYEFGGGNGQISATGMSGLFFDSLHDGHYVSIQRLPDATALVIWNTFDENGVPAWLYGVGAVSGQSIHVDQFARNSGGKLLPGGDVVGSHASLWGSVDVSLSDCYNAQLNYSSSDPTFGSGSISLQRLALLEGVDCAL